MIDAFLFDAYGTLFDVHTVIATCERLWPGDGDRLSHLWRQKQLEYTWLRSLMRRHRPFAQLTRDALAHACASLRLPLDDEAADLLMRAYRELDIFPDVTATLARLRPRRLAILSNGSFDMLEPLVARAGLVLDGVLSVESVGVYKPAPDVYRHGADYLGLPPERIGFVSANCWDALGAKSFGFHVFWINRAGAPLDALDVRPDQVLTSLAEIP